MAEVFLGNIKGPKGDNGNGIIGIVKTATNGLVDTYTVNYTNGTTDFFLVTNGAAGATGADGAPGLIPELSLDEEGNLYVEYVESLD